MSKTEDYLNELYTTDFQCQLHEVVVKDGEVALDAEDKALVVANYTVHIDTKSFLEGATTIEGWYPLR